MEFKISMIGCKKNFSVLTSDANHISKWKLKMEVGNSKGFVLYERHEPQADLILQT